MKSFSWIFFGLLLTSGAAIAATTSAPATFTPDSLHWVAGTGAAKGSSAAVMVGDPAKSGTAIIRVKMPDGYTNRPHYHSHPEYITVMSGTLLFGIGDTIDTAKAMVLPAGSFIAVPAGVHHWSVAKGETVEQVGGEGPLTNILVKHGGM
ncbi:MAG: cupin domain-containing protein [Candidatus Baltobacteraceae bacterium]